ncbi:hypothetical protein [Verminephrobacter eiseniae]|uniref:hypothetical protein n=1 Tax=Verminephrobacter eiseniae TaxID=364317 RepID=UPI002236FEA4|nr:hypothetical protein [Verminephrobacter eiseniae]
MSRHRSSVGLRWPSKRIAALHRLPIRSVLAARCALRCAPMAARSLRHLIGDTTLARPQIKLRKIGARSELDRSIRADDASFDKHIGAIAVLQGNVKFLLDKQHRHTRRTQDLQRLENLLHDHGRKAHERLVQQQQTRR